MLLTLTEYLARFYSGFHVFQYLTLRGDSGGIHRAGAVAVDRPDHDFDAGRYQIGQRGAQRRPAVASAEVRHAHHGRRADPGDHGPGHAAVGGSSSRFVWVLLGVTLGFGVIGFYDDYRKLVLGNSRAWRRAGSTSGNRCLEWRRLFSVSPRQSPAETSLYVPLFKNVAVPMSTAGVLRGDRLLHHRRLLTTR